MQKPMNRKLLGNFFLFLTAMIWGLAFVAQREGATRIEPAVFTASRMALATMTVGVVLLFSKGMKKTDAFVKSNVAADSKNENLRGGVTCGVFLAAACLLQQMGLRSTTAGKAGFITAMYILFVPIIHTIVFHKKNLPSVWLAVMLGVIGMYLLCMTDGFRLTQGDTLVLLCALLYSGHILCCDYFARRGDPLRIAGIQFLTCAVLCGILAAFTEHPQPEMFHSAVSEILYCGILSGGVGYTLQMVAQGFTDPSVASLLMSLESVFAAIFGVLLLGERMQPREFLGCFVLFVAIILVQLPEKTCIH